MEKKNIYELLTFILESLEMIEERFVIIEQSDDFIDTKEGLLMLDAISMRLQSFVMKK